MANPFKDDLPEVSNRCPTSSSVGSVVVTVEREQLGRRWEVFAEQECRGYSPLYESICRSVAVDEDLLALVESGPRSARQPNVLLASVHYLLLGGVDHPLADVYAGDVARGRSAALPGLLPDTSR